MALVGDLTHERTVNSLALILARFPNIRLRFVSPSTLRIRPELRDELTAAAVRFDESEDLALVAPTADVLYLTRAQTERMSLAQRFDPAARGYRVDSALLATMHPDAVVLHPLPRGPELDPALDIDSRIACFRQAANGLFVRMALLSLLMSERR